MGLDHGITIKKNGRGNNKPKEAITFRKCNQIHGWFLRNCVVYKYPDLEEWDGSPVEIKSEDLWRLRKTIKTVLSNSKLFYYIGLESYRPKHIFGKSIKDYKFTLKSTIIKKDMAKKLLPTEDGFFFGSLKYDGYYISQLKYAYNELGKLLDNTDFEKYSVYYWGWW